MAYSGRYTVKNPSKYLGDPKEVVYRSLWEKHVMKWCDNSSQVKKWASEEVVIPYLCETDKKMHRYFMDFLIHYDTGRTVLVEVKPHKETERPKTGRGRSRKQVMSEGLTYIKNQSKWKTAREYALNRGWHFEIWTEKELSAMGILPKSTRQLKPFTRKKVSR
jgi:hypothetical protein